MNDYGDYINGFIERKSGGKYEGQLRVDGVELSPVEGVYFEKENKKYLWIKRKPVMEFNDNIGGFRTRKPTPYVECYLEKQLDENTVAYKGTLMFLRFRYSIVGVWDRIFGKDMRRLNLYVERLPMSEQTILIGINERKRND